MSFLLKNLLAYKMLLSTKKLTVNNKDRNKYG